MVQIKVKYQIMNELLKKILPPPEKPLETDTNVTWEIIENEIGIVLPNDYKWFIETYGSGEIGNFIYLWNPLSNKKYFVKRMQSNLNGLRSMKLYLSYEDWQKEVPHPLYPEPKGLLPFGSTINGDVFYWQTERQSDIWHILINEVRSNIYEYHPVSITNFLYMLILGTVSTFINTTDFDKTAGFKSYS